MTEILQPGEQNISIVGRGPHDFLYGNFKDALRTDEYEVALQATNELHALQGWRKATNTSPFPQFYQLFEAATRVNGVLTSEEQKMILREKVVDTLYPKACALSPRVRDLYIGLLSELSGQEVVHQFPITERQIASLKESGDFDIMQDPSVAWDIKINRMLNRIESELLGRKALDRRDKKMHEEKEGASESIEGEPSLTPPPANNESKPSMDEMSRLKEGEEAQAIWTVSPAYGGYFKEQSFDTWDVERNTWIQSGYDFFETGSTSSQNKENALVISATVAGGNTRLPCPYTYAYPTVVEGNCKVFLDQNGGYMLTSSNSTPSGVKIRMLPEEEYLVISPQETPELLTFPANLTPETIEKLNEIKIKRKTSLDRARALRTYVMKHLEYSNDSSYNILYENFPDGYINAIDRFKKADCDVANTYFAALCTQLEIPVRHVVGHMVKGKDKSGNSRITSGTGHAWSEVWDNEASKWTRIDATPAGDPQQEQDEQNKSESAPGDYGEGSEAIMPNDETLKDLEEKLSKLTGMLGYTPEERRMSEATGVDLKEARQIVREIQQAEDTRLPNGERVVDVMSQLFSLIVDSRKLTVPYYTGLVRKREGGEEIDDIVAHKIGIVGGDMDPASRQKETVIIKEEKLFDGLDVYMIGDKSGSMSETVDGEMKWQLQRRAEYLIFSSLYRFQQNLERASVRLAEPLSVRTQAISFRDGNTIDVDKELSNKFSLIDKVKLWKSLGNQGYGNGDIAALDFIYEKIIEEQEALLAKGKKDSRIRIILACSDGMPDSPEGVHVLAQKLGELNSVVVGIGLTETASQVPIIFNTPYSRGDIAYNINSLPGIVAKHIVQRAIKLFPDRTAPLYQKQIESILAKFDRVGLR